MRVLERRRLRADAGALDQRFVLERPVTTPDGFGGQLTTWESQGAIWAAAQPVSADDAVRGGQRDEDVTHRLVVRHRRDLLAGARLRRGSRTLQVRTVRDADERGRYLVIEARERA